MGHEQILLARQQLEEGRAGTRAQDAPWGGAVQGGLQVFQVTPQLQQARGMQDNGYQVEDTLAQEPHRLRALCPSVWARGCFSIPSWHPSSLSREGKVSIAVGKLRQGAAVGLGGTQNLPWLHPAPAAEDKWLEKVGEGDLEQKWLSLVIQELWPQSPQQHPSLWGDHPPVTSEQELTGSRRASG